MNQPTRIVLVLSAALTAAASASCERAGAHGQAADAGRSTLPRTDALDLRRVWAGTAFNFYPSNPSPDGRLISEIDWDTGDLAVIDLEAGKMRRVTNKGPWSQSGDYAEFSAFSPDGERLAYSWFSREADGYQVRSTRLDGSDMRVVFPRRPDVAYVAVEDWSPDGKHLAAIVARNDRTTQIGLIDAANGQYRALKTTDWQPPSMLAFSRDSRFIAYDLPRKDDHTRSDIFVIAADGSRETTVVSGPGHNQLLGWLPSGDGILYHRRESGARAIMAIAVRDGRAADRPVLVRPAEQVLPLGFSRDAFYYGVDVERPHVRVAGVDLTTGRVVSEPASLSDPLEGASHDAAWSPDSQTVAYLVGAPGGSKLVIRSVTGGVQREIPVPLSQARNTRWAPDGSAVYVYGTDPEGRIGIHRLNLRSGELSGVLVGGPGGEAEGRAFWDISPDGRTIYHRRPKDASQTLALSNEGAEKQAGHVIVAHDLRTGTVREVVQAPAGRHVSVSPDGTRLAYSGTRDGTSLWIVPTAGGTAREVFHRTGGSTLGNRAGLEWSPDGESILFFHRQNAPDDSPDDGKGGIWQIPTNGGDPRLLFDPRVHLEESARDALGPWNFRLSRDGRNLLFESGRIRGEIWMLSGFAAASGR